MLKKTIAISLVLGLVSTPAFAQDDELPEASIDVSLAFVSNYLFRGTDIHANRAVQKGESYGSHTGEWAFQPSVTFNTPDGMFFNIWGSFAMAGRTDQDTDYLLQTGPGGADLITATNTTPISAYTANAPIDPNTSLEARLAGSEQAGTGYPGFYEEQNGLERVDELDFTIGYSADTSIGSIGFGYVAYTGANDRYPFGSGTDEIFVSYGLPMIPLSLSVWTDVDTSTLAQYIDLTYGDSIEIAENIGLDYSFGAGYGRQPYVSALRDIHAGITLNAYGFFVGYNVVQRQDWRFFDTDGLGAGDENLPAWAVGRSTTGDGLVGDPSRTSGPVNSYINSNVATNLAALSGHVNYGSAASSSSATYTPRQKLPRTLWFVTVGYGFSI